MSLSRAESYVSKVPPASEGGRNNALNTLAYQVLERFDLQEGDFERLMLSWAASCSPPITEREALDTIHSAWSGAHRKGSVGAKARAPGRSHHTGHSSRPAAPTRKPDAPTARETHYDLSDSPDELPEPVEDGARLLLRHCFEPREGIRIVNATIAEDGGEVPDGKGPCLSREEWLRKLDAVDGNPNGIFSSSRKTGIYIAINPLKIGGSLDSDVTAYRHALVEFDDGLSPQEQWNLYRKSNLPCACVIYSGGKSVHAWVKIGAKDRQEYDDRVKQLYAHFEGSGYKLDTKNKNPSRLSRLPFCVRFDKRQELLTLNSGAESFSDWLAQQQADGIGTVRTVDELLAYDTSKDPNTVLGDRWLCRGGSCLLIGPSGVGKSSLAVQAAALWAVGLPFIGITPVKPLKVLVIQAENDDGDLAEMLSGVVAGMPLLDDTQYAALRSNIIFVRDTTHTGLAFTEACRRLIDRHKPDLVVLDPLLSFIGADISKQEVCSEFLRSWLNPIAEATGVIWFCVHHTGKPSTDPRSKKHWQSADYSYSGIGSSELTNWTRATMVLEQAGDGAFRLMLSKRGKRAGAIHPNGEPTSTAWLRHAQKGVFWQQLDPPESESRPSEATKHKKQTKEERIYNMVKSTSAEPKGFMCGCKDEGELPMEFARRLQSWLMKDAPTKMLFEDHKSGTLRRAMTLMACGDDELKIGQILTYENSRYFKL